MLRHPNCRCVVIPMTTPANDDRITVQFIHLLCSDPELDHDLGRLLGLFAVDAPATYGGYAHHASGR